MNALGRTWSSAVIVGTLLATLGCESQVPGQLGRLDLVWGRRGLSDGRLQKPRALAIDPQDQLYIVDMTARVQVFTPDGEFLRSWQTPEHANGRPTGIAVDRRGRIVVADTHYYQVLIYSPTGELISRLGGTRGPAPGQFNWVTDAVDDAAGNLYVSEYGELDRIQKFSPAGEFLAQWGAHGSEPGQFIRPQDLAFDELDRLWVCDAGNHRLQVFDTQGQLLFHWGTHGSGLGELSYPYDLEHDPDGSVWVLEYGNHRVQKFTRDGRSLGCWGHEGRGPGELHNPWAVVRDRRGRLYVLDTNNHRVQRVTP